jgi:hypothetical protein
MAKNNYLPAILNKALVTLFEDPTGLDRPLWRDYSRHQKFVNSVVAIQNGVHGFAHRATISWGYKDPYFSANWAAFDGYPVYRTSYHVIYPGEPVIRQLDNWYSVHDEIETVPRVLDLELHHNQPVKKIADVTWEMAEIIEARDGIPPILYTRRLLANSWLASWTKEMKNHLWWWLAQYLYNGYIEHPGEPTRPIGVEEERIILHQTSDKKLAPAGEVESKSVDWNRWEIGNKMQMHEWISSNWGGAAPPPPPDEIEPIEPIEKRIVTASALNMRSLPSSKSKDIGTLKNGSDVSITQIAGEWGKAEGWIHLDYTDRA